MRIAVWQAHGTPGDVAANLAALDRACARAAAAGAGLLVTPEMFVTGYDIGAAVLDLAAGDLVTPVRDIARRHGVALVVGLPLPSDDPARVRNAAVAVSATGDELGRYTKAHLFGDLDRRWFVPGTTPFTLVQVGELTVALLICYDVEFPEPVRAAALAGAHLVAVPTAQMQPYGHVAERLLPVRAWESQVFVAYADHHGTEGTLDYVGLSCVAAPDGTVPARAGTDGEALLLADVDPAAVARSRAENPYLLDRRTDLYPDLGPAPAA